MPPSSFEQPLSMPPEVADGYGSTPDEVGRFQRDELASLAAIAYNLDKRGNPERTHVLRSGGTIANVGAAALFELVHRGLRDSSEAPNQSEQTRQVTLNHLGRAMILAGDNQGGLEIMRKSFHQLDGTRTGENLFGEDQQLKLDMLGGMALAEVGLGYVQAALDYGRHMSAELPRDMSRRERVKRIQLRAGVTGATALYAAGASTIAQVWARNNLPSRILHEPLPAQAA